MHSHVDLFVGLNASGQPVLEQVPAERVAGDEYLLLGTPGLALGCAKGDVVKVAGDGTFEVVFRGGNLSVLVYGNALNGVFYALRRTLASIGGAVEAPDDVRFIVATVPVSAGFSAIERAIEEAMSEASDAEWSYGNVYDGQGQPLNWWVAVPPV